MARGKIQDWVEIGGNTVTTDGRISITKVQRSFPSATITVFESGTSTLATIFSTEAGAAKSNPFLADSNGHWDFWADSGRYDIQYSGGGLTSPYTLFAVEPVISAVGLPDPGANGIVVRTALSTVVARTLLGTSSEIVIVNGDGVSGNPVISLDVALNFVGKTITGGTYVSPTIVSFQNAQHTHQDVAGGGQLNATSIFSTGTVPIARLPILVGATGVTAGTAGIVPAPLAGDESKFLRGDGTWQVTGGGGGTPASPNLSLQYNNAGAFGGVTGSSSDGTQVTFTSGILRATSPRITTSIFDSNGLSILTLTPVASSVNQITIANSATGGHPVLSVTGSDANVNLVLTPKGSGIVDTVGNFRITNNAPQITLIDANDSKTVRMSVNGANWDFANDTLGTVPIRIDTTTNNITVLNNFSITSTPILTFNRASVSKTWIQTINSTGEFVIGENSISNAIVIAHTTGVCTFEEIPIGPAANPTTANQLTRKEYIDIKTTAFSINFFESDPTVLSFVTEDRASVIIPDGTNMLLTKLRICYVAGSHTTGGTLSYIIRRHPNGSATDIDLGTVTLDNTNNATRIVYTVDIADVALTSGDIITYYMSNRTGTITERAVTVSAIGTQRLST